jgi:hypothetical protein
MGNMISRAKNIVESSEHSTTYATNGDISLNAANQVKLRSTDKVVYDKYQAPEKKHKELKKFMIHFRRPASYKGEYGFDWLRDEYIHSIYLVMQGNSGAMKPLSNDVEATKKEYLKDVKNPIKPYGKDYYPAWLSLFPHTTAQQFKYGSDMNKNGVQLDLELEEIEEVISDGTQIILESKNPHLKVSPAQINIGALIGAGKKKKYFDGQKIGYYTLKGAVNIVNNGAPLKQHEEIKIFAKLGDKKEEVGKLMVYNNHVIPKLEIVLVRVNTKKETSGNIKKQLVKDAEYQFKHASFNQALIRAEVKTDTDFNVYDLPEKDPEVTYFWDRTLMASVAEKYQDQLLQSIIRLYEKYGKHKPVGGSIDGDANKRTYMFLTDLEASALAGLTSTRAGDIVNEFQWGNSYMIFLSGLSSRRTLIHEAGHSLGLQHTFSTGDPLEGLTPPPYTLYKGYTDNIMDYTWQEGNNDNPFKEHMYAFFKFQWDIMRKDRSLILNY